VWGWCCIFGRKSLRELIRVRRRRSLLELKGRIHETHRRAARIYYDCRRAGRTVRSGVDCLVARLALDRGGFLQADDRDCAGIAVVRPLKIVKTVTVDEESDVH
jgi:hypothetical protein